MFNYQPERITVGMVYHYLKTNKDGTTPEHIAHYIAAPDQLVAFKYHPGEEPAAWVEATMDWHWFTAVHLESWQLFANGDKKLIATLAYQPQLANLVVQMAWNETPFSIPMPQLPVHLYNFDLGSLNFAFHHLMQPQSRFIIGIIDPTWREEGPPIEYKGDVEVAYVGETNRQGVACYQYQIDGAGFAQRGGMIWVDKAGGHFQDVEIDLPDNPSWHSFKFQLQNMEQMSPTEWEAFMQAQF